MAGGAAQAVPAAMQVPWSAQPATRWGMLSRTGADARSVAREWRTQDPEQLWNGVPVLGRSSG